MRSNATPLKNALKDGMPRVYVAQVDGEPWIGTPYFFTTAGEGARTLLAKNNLDTSEHTPLAVNGSVTREAGDVPELRQVLAVPDATVTLARVELAGYEAFIVKDGLDLALFERPDGRRVAVNRQYLAAIAGEIDPNDAGIVATQEEIRMVKDYAQWHRADEEPSKCNAHLRPVHLSGPDGRAVLMPYRIER